MPGVDAYACTGRVAQEERSGRASGIVRLSDLIVNTGGASPVSPAEPRQVDPSTDAESLSPPLKRNQEASFGRTAALAASVQMLADADGTALTDRAADVGLPYDGLFGPRADGRARRSPPARPPATAMQRALGLLTRREHSRKELTRKLVSRGVDASEVEVAVEKLAAAGWQDERRFAESLIRSRASAGYGPLYLRAELGTHDLPPDLREQVLDAFEGDWGEIARDLVARRFGTIEGRRLRERKALDLLLRRGFPMDVARSAVSVPPAD